MGKKVRHTPSKKSGQPNIHGRSHICAIKRRHHAIAAEENRLDRIEGTLINKMQPSMVQVVSA